MTLNPSGRIATYQRLFAEGAVIVFGILIALAADAAWDERVERSAERTALRQLLAEFEENSTALGTTLAAHRTGLEGANVLVRVGRGAIEVDSDSLRTLIGRQTYAYSFTPRLGALQSLISSGQLGIIRDDSLRITLAGWQGTLAGYLDNERGAIVYSAGPQYEVMSRLVNWGDLFGPEEDRRLRSLDHLVGNADLESVVAYRIDYYAVILRQGDEMLDKQRQIVEMLRSNLREAS